MNEERIHELEEEYGVELDGNFDTSVICSNPECDCWADMELAIRRQLQSQIETAFCSCGTEIVLGEERCEACEIVYTPAVAVPVIPVYRRAA